VAKLKNKKIIACLGCGKDTTNKEFCSGNCRKKFNLWSKECEHTRSKYLSFRGCRAWR